MTGLAEKHEEALMGNDGVQKNERVIHRTGLPEKGKAGE
jgi:hypothetical protein